MVHKIHITNITKLMHMAELLDGIDLDSFISIHENSLPLIPIPQREDSQLLIDWAKSLRTIKPRVEAIKNRGMQNHRNMKSAKNN